MYRWRGWADGPGYVSEVSGVTKSGKTEDKTSFSNVSLRKWRDSRLLWERVFLSGQGRPGWSRGGSEFLVSPSPHAEVSLCHTISFAPLFPGRARFSVYYQKAADSGVDFSPLSKI